MSSVRFRMVTCAVLVAVLAMLPGVAIAQEKVLPPAPAVAVPLIPSQCETVPGNLVMNCGFETGNLLAWDQTGDLGFTSVTIVPHSGTFGLHAGPVGGEGFITQFLVTPVGATCYISFWLRNFGQPNAFEVDFNGAQVFAGGSFLGGSDFGNFDYHLFAFIAPGVTSATFTQLTFGFQNVPSFFDLDDIVVTCQ